MTNISLEKYRPVKYQKTIIWITYIILYIGLNCDFPQLKGWATDPNAGQQRAGLVLIITPSLSSFDIWWSVVLCSTYKSREWWHAECRGRHPKATAHQPSRKTTRHTCALSQLVHYSEKGNIRIHLFCKMWPLSVAYNVVHSLPGLRWVDFIRAHLSFQGIGGNSAAYWKRSNQGKKKD